MKSAATMLLNKAFQQVWERGEQYADSPRIIITHYDDKKVEAAVQGTQPYAVSIEFVSNGTRRRCNCPYFAGNNTICKHVVAVAIRWDALRGIPRPSRNDVVTHTAQPRPTYREEIDALFDDPLEADLDFLRALPELTALSGRGRPHSELPDAPQIDDDPDAPVNVSEVRKCFSEMKRWARRQAYDPYFCAGEMVAAFCELARVVGRRLNKTAITQGIDVVLEAARFHTLMVMELIDDSEGLRVVSEAHLADLLLHLQHMVRGTPDEGMVRAATDEFHELIE
jgi:hypothetical protein